MNPITTALKGKGPFKLMQRAASICKGYGTTPRKMDRALEHFSAILSQFGCSATFPITAVALARNSQVIKTYQEQGIEFAIHGYRHIDHCQLSQAEQLSQLASAQQSFASAGIHAQGFRGPYLHANADTLLALRLQGLTYDSSQGLSWDLADGYETPAYRHVLGFYAALSASDYPSLPRLEGELIHLPYSLPDDEALVHRLSLGTIDQMVKPWLVILRRSYELGELFTLGLHPERAFICQEPLTAVLAEARRLDPPVWIARLHEISDWWRARYEAQVEIVDITDSKLHVTVMGPQGSSVLARGVQIEGPTLPWIDGYQQVLAAEFTLLASFRPFVGLSPRTSPQMVDFLRQQGYMVEISAERRHYACYFDQAEFAAEDQRSLLAQIEESECPLVRLGRWPNAARSALAITGDVDAVTLWDYGLRLLGR